MASRTPGPVVREGSRPPKERLTSIKSQSLRSRRPPRRQAPKVVQCPECGAADIQEYNGNTVCGECGTTINESNIVSEVTFGETAAGAAVVQGAFIGADQRHAKGDGGRFGRGYSTREPREVSEMNGKEELRKQANWHHLPEHVFDQGFSIYKLALNNNFIQGRHISIVAAVCLYAACRRDRESQMLLIDFAEGVAVNVFRLGQTWSDLKKTLFLDDLHHRPVMEVEDLIARFVRKLEFGRDMKKVANDALLILRRMKRDWMVTGRLPNGLIGACIILAARMNNYRRTVREVVYVVKVGDLTVFKRLEEFKRTPAAGMSVEDFRETGLRLKQGMPPAIYDRAERDRKRKLHAMLNGGNVEEQDRERSPSEAPAKQSTLDEILQRREPRIDSDGFAVPEVPIDPRLHDSPRPSADGESRPATPSVDGSTAGPAPSKPRRGRPPKSREPQGPPAQFTEEDLISEVELEQEMEVILSDTQAFMTADPETVTVNEAGEARSKELAESIRNGAQRPRAPVSEDREVSAAEFEDDPEVAHCLLSEEETKIKERIWVTHNEDWLRSQQAKMLKKALAEAQGTDEKKDRNKKKRKRVRVGDGSLLEGTPAESAADAARIMLEKHARGPSKHINYKNVEALYKEFRGADSSEASVSRSGSVARADSMVPPDDASQRATSLAAERRPEDIIATPLEDTSTTDAGLGLPTPAPTQATPGAEATPLNVDEKSRKGEVVPEREAIIPSENIGEEDSDDDEDDEDEPGDAWNSDDEEGDVDVARTARAAGIDMGDIDEDETAGWSEHEGDE